MTFVSGLKEQMNLPGNLLRSALAILISMNILAAWAQPVGMSKPRLIVLTDISSLTQGEAEPDDGQSMTRLMLYCNDLDLEGLIATSNMGHGQKTRPELIHQVIEAYAKVRPSLLRHDAGYPAPDVLAAVVKAGTPTAGPHVPVDTSIGEGKDTEGSNWIIRTVDKDDSRPVWVAIWGGSADLAQALWKVRATRTPGEIKKFVSKLRVHMIYDQDMTGPWIRKEFPGLFCIFRHHGIRGMYRGGDTTLVRSQWVRTNLRHHGALGDLYVEYHGGDIWGRQLGRVNGIKEGDTPSILYLLTNGLNDPDHPEWGNWSGRFQKDNAANALWTEAVDSIGNYKTDMDPRMAALYRWRPAWQADFAARLDWCVKAFADANHAPNVTGGTQRVDAEGGGQVRLIVKASDPDNDKLNYRWFFYPEEGTYRGPIPLITASGKAATFHAPASATSETLHVIVEVTDNGEPALTSYQRFIVSLKPQKKK
jgi:hypothetical protein